MSGKGVPTAMQLARTSPCGARARISPLASTWTRDSGCGPGHRSCGAGQDWARSRICRSAHRRVAMRPTTVHLTLFFGPGRKRPLRFLDLPEQFLRLRDQLPEVRPLRLHLGREHAMLEGVPVSLRRAGASRTAMHPAALLASNRRRLTERTLAGLRPTARAVSQSRSVARMTTGHDGPEWVWSAARPGRTRPRR